VRQRAALEGVALSTELQVRRDSCTQMRCEFHIFGFDAHLPPNAAAASRQDLALEKEQLTPFDETTHNGAPPNGPDGGVTLS
jgi:hypothetical protein